MWRGGRGGIGFEVRGKLGGVGVGDGEGWFELGGGRGC